MNPPDPFEDYLTSKGKEGLQEMLFVIQHLYPRLYYFANVVSTSKRLLEVFPDFLRRQIKQEVGNAIWDNPLLLRQYFESLNEEGILCLQIPNLEPQSRQAAEYADTLQHFRDWISHYRKRIILLMDPQTYLALRVNAPDYFSLAHEFVELVDLKALYERADQGLRIPLSLAIAEGDLVDATHNFSLVQGDGDTELFRKGKANLIHALANTDRWTEVEKECESFLPLLKNSNEAMLAVEIGYCLASAKFRLGKMEESMEIAKATILANQHLDSLYIGACYELLAFGMLIQGEYENALNTFDAAEPYFDGLRVNHKTQISRAEILSSMGKYDQAINILEQNSVSLDDLRKGNYDEGAEIYRIRLLGEIYIKQGQIPQALHCLNQGEALARNAGHIAGLVMILLLLSAAYIYQYRTEEASALVYEAEKRIQDYESPDHAFDLIDLRKRLAETKALLTAHDTSAENTDPPSPPGAPA